MRDFQPLPGPLPEPLPEALPDDVTLARYVAGECDPAERERVERMASASTAYGVIVEAARMAWAAWGDVWPHGDVETFVQRLRQLRHEAPRPTPHPTAHAPRHAWAARPARTAHGRWYAGAGLAAAILAIVGGVYVGAPRGGRNVVAAAAVTTYVTGNAERARIALPDGDTVSLDVASRLEVPMNYLAGNHTLQLTGEASFTVVHHTGAPLTVVAGGAATRVLGTSFIVRHYPGDTATLVAVREGKVAIRRTVLAASQEMDVTPSGESTIRSLRPGRFSFTTGVLTLESVPAREAIAELDRWYDADIRLGDPTLAATRVTGQCVVGTLADLTEILEWTFNARVVRNGRVLTIFPRQS